MNLAVMRVYREVNAVLRAVSSGSGLLNLRNGLNLLDASMQEELERMHASVAVGEKRYQLRVAAEPVVSRSVGETGLFGGKQGVVVWGCGCGGRGQWTRGIAKERRAIGRSAL